jgi:WD40 repeat protein
VIITGSRDHTLRVWDVRSRATAHVIRGHRGSVTCVGASGWRLLSGGGYNRGADDDEVLSVDATLRLWDLRRLAAGAPSCAVWTREAPSLRSDHDQGGFPLPMPHGDPLLSLQLLEDKVLTSHGGKHWTARIWDLE